MYQTQSICEIVRKAEDNFTTGATTISKYVDHNLYLILEKIHAYLNSTHISGRKDSMDRIKPFFNIVTSAVNIWYRATDLDRKNIKFKTKKNKKQMQTFFANTLLGDLMRKTNFGKFLNSWGLTLARYGSAVCKFVEKDGELISEVISWHNLIVDAISFDNNVVIEKLWMTPAQLRKNKNYNQDFVKQLIDSVGPRETMDDVQRDNKSEYIEIYEVHGELPLSLLKKAKGEEPDEEDDDIFVQQMHVVSFISKKLPDTDEEYFDEYTLYAGKEAKSPYMITHLIPEDGRTLGRGAVENLFEAQFMVNHTVKQIKDQLDLASKLLFQTSDGNLAGQNVLKNIQSGDILKHAKNEPLTKLNNDATDTGSLMAVKNDWMFLSKDITSTPDASRGNTMPSGTAYRQVAALIEQSNDLFEIMTENKGLDLEEMLRKYHIPHLKKKMDTSEEITAILEDYEIKQIDARYVPTEAKKRAANKLKREILNKPLQAIISGNLPTEEDKTIAIEKETNNIKEEFDLMGNQRFFKPSDIETKTWKDALEGFEWEAEIEITNENTDKQAMFSNINALLQMLANPNFTAFLQTDDGRMIFNRLLGEIGAFSPVEMSFNKSMPAQPPAQPVVAGGGAMPAMQ